MTRARCPSQSVRICTPTGGHNDENPTESGDPKDRSHSGTNRTEKYVEIIQFPISKTNVGTLELPPSTVHDLATFAKRLRDAGMILPKDDEELKKLLSSVAKSCPPKEQVYEVQTGWTKDRKAFVLVNGVIGNVKTKIIGVNPANAVNDRSGRPSNRGSWRSWRDRVAEPARHSTILMLAICVALAAPLLAIVNRPSFTVNLFGRSRVGKSVATLVGASVIGTAQSRRSDRVEHHGCSAGGAHRQSSTTRFSQLMIFQISNGTKKEKYQRIRDVAYRISQGWSTARHSSFTASHGGVHGNWRSIALTSSEKSIRDLARSVNLDRQHGEALRLIDQPAVFDGLDHIFDRLPDDLDKSRFQDWKKDAFREIAEACKRNHGSAFRKYIRALIADRAALKKYVHDRIADFVRHVCDGYDGGVAREVAETYGLAYAGGRLGIRCGLLRWSNHELLDALIKRLYCCTRLVAKQWRGYSPRRNGSQSKAPRAATHLQESS